MYNPFIIVHIFLVVCLNCHSLDSEFPAISIRIGAYEETIYNSDVSFIFPGNFDLIQLDCTSSYPTVWTFSSNPLRDYHITFTIDKTRNAVDINDKATYTFLSRLTFSFKDPIIHQNVSCGHILRNYINLTSSVYLATTAGRKLVVKVQYGEVLKGSEVSSYPRFGLNENCSLFLHFDKAARTYGCSNADPNSTRNTFARILPCNNYDECNAFVREDYHCRDQTLIENCKLSTCANMPKNSAGVIICEFDNISVGRAVYLTVQEPPNYYMKRDDVKVSEILKLWTLTDNVTLQNIEGLWKYKNGTLQLGCSGSASYFSKGFRWAIKFVEGNVKLLGTKQSHGETYSTRNQAYTSTLDLHLTSTSINSIICYAPVLNSYRYESVIVNLDVIDDVDYMDPDNEYNDSDENSKSKDHTDLEGNTNITLIVSICTTIVAVVALIGGLITVNTYLHRKPTILSDVDMQRFLLGDVNVASNPLSNVDGMPYDQEYEVDWSILKIDLMTILGSGAFGIVFQGVYGSRHVAVKTVRAGTGKEYLISLLSELKIMIYLKHHPNLVSLVGARTRDLRQGQLYIVVELCPGGSLEGHLIRHRDTFIKNRGSSCWMLALESYSSRTSQQLTTEQLFRWGYQICLAMEYLESMKVIHSDLATRNVLLTENLQAKVSDFGLSRKLYQYDVYVKEQKVPLPWRWMAIESLQRREFSHKSDCWSFAVTLWEIYSIGDLPYHGMEYTVDFVDNLCGGMRLGKPNLAPENIFEIMRKCWNNDPNERPAFSMVKALLSDALGIPFLSDVEFGSLEPEYSQFVTTV